jgi:hypothetical protein
MGLRFLAFTSLIFVIFLSRPGFAQPGEPIGQRLVDGGVTLYEAAIKSGVPKRPLDLALAYFDLHKEKLSNQNYITVIDYRMHSANERFFLINLNSGLVTKELVSHGKGSDPEHDGLAKKFSNVSGSFASSLGFYQVSEDYVGDHGLSVRLDGLSAELNSNARDRAIVIHGADYVAPGLDKMGRSLGCPALQRNNAGGIVEKIKNGSLLFIYAAVFEAPK